MENLKTIFRNKKFIFHIKKKLGPYLSKGKYIINFKDHKLEKNDKKVNFYKRFFYCFDNKFNGSEEYLTFVSGTTKRVFYYKDKVFLFYKLNFPNRNQIKIFLQNYKDFNYKKPKIIEIDKRCHLMVCERIKGKQYYDKKHNERIQRFLFSNCGKAFVNKLDNSNTTFLSYGDAKPENIIWVGNEAYFVDLDDIGYRPFLFDFIHFSICIGLTLSEILLYIKNHFDLILDLIISFKMPSNVDEFIDYILYQYFNWYLKNNIKQKGDYDFLYNKEIEKYKMTYNLVKIHIGI